MLVSGKKSFPTENETLQCFGRTQIYNHFVLKAEIRVPTNMRSRRPVFGSNSEEVLFRWLRCKYCGHGPVSIFENCGIKKQGKGNEQEMERKGRGKERKGKRKGMKLKGNI